HNQIGLLVRQCPGCVLAGLESTGDHRGAVIARQSTGAVVRDGSVTQADTRGIDVVAAQAELHNMAVSVTDGATGVRLSTTAIGTHVEGSSVRGGRIGIFVDATSTQITGVTVANASIGVRVSGTAEGTALRQLTANQNGTGLVVQHGPATVTAVGLHVE